MAYDLQLTVTVYHVYSHIIYNIIYVDAIEKVPVQGKKSVPVTDIVLQRVTIHANPMAP